MIDLNTLLAGNRQLTTGSDIAVAVSGGADSMALMLMAKEWADANNRKIVVLTVDHGLRKESKKEAEQVGKWCKSYAIEHHILSIQDSGFRIQGKIQETARKLRYHLITRWCKRNDVGYLLTAHHRGDQAETLFFRLARGSGIRGLACMSITSEIDGIHLVRPLLDVGKKELMEYLRKHRQYWIEDPSNQNLTYTRNAIRAQLQTLPNKDEIEIRAAKIVAFFGRVRAELDKKTYEAFEQLVTPHDQYTEINAKLFADLPKEIGLLLAAHLIQSLTGDDHPPRTEKLERLYCWLIKPNSKQTSLAHLIFEHHLQYGHFRVYSKSSTS